MKNVIIPGASGNVPRHVIEASVEKRSIFRYEPKQCQNGVVVGTGGSYEISRYSGTPLLPIFRRTDW